MFLFICQHIGIHKKCIKNGGFFLYFLVASVSFVTCQVIAGSLMTNDSMHVSMYMECFECI